MDGSDFGDGHVDSQASVEVEQDESSMSLQGGRAGLIDDGNVAFGVDVSLYDDTRSAIKESEGVPENTLHRILSSQCTLSLSVSLSFFFSYRQTSL
jgi:hypothetical protein